MRGVGAIHLSHLADDLEQQVYETLVGFEIADDNELGTWDSYDVTDILPIEELPENTNSHLFIFENNQNMTECVELDVWTDIKSFLEAHDKNTGYIVLITYHS